MNIHLIIQGKGGVGKSYASLLLAQYFQEKGADPICIDTDPVNRTFTRFKSLNVEPLELMDNGNIDHRTFDVLLDKILLADESEKPQTMIVDNGASSFVPLCSYMVENDVVTELKEAGHTLYLHTIVTGGANFIDTSYSFKNICEHFPETPIVLWLNEYFGSTAAKGTEFEKTKIFSKVADKVHGIVRLPELRKETFGRDIADMLGDNLTFAEAREHTKFPIMMRSRLHRTWLAAQAELEKAGL